MVQVAQAAADAAKEGGFMGFKAERVSQRLETMIPAVVLRMARLRPSAMLQRSTMTRGLGNSSGHG